MTKNRFVTSLLVISANVTDETSAIPLYEQQASKPSTLVGDGAFGIGKNRRYFNQNNCAFAAPSRGQENPQNYFPKDCLPGMVRQLPAQEERLRTNTLSTKEHIQ